MGELGRRSGRAGFTMVELVISLVIALVVVLAIGRLMNFSQEAWAAGRDRALLQQNASEVLDRLCRSVRAARTIQLVDVDEFRTYDALGDLVHTYQFVQEGDRPGTLQEDGVAVAEQEFVRFECDANTDETSLTIALEMRDGSGNSVTRETRITLRNRTIEF